MDCVCCGSAAVTERPERTARGYRRFRCRDCGRQFNEPSAGVLNRAQYPSDVIALVVLWRLLYRLTLRDLCEMFLAPRPRVQPRGGAGLGRQARAGPGRRTPATPARQGQSPRPDDSRVRDRRAACNLAVLRRIAIGLFGRDRPAKASARARRKKAAWNDDHMLQLLTG